MVKKKSQPRFRPEASTSLSPTSSVWTGPPRSPRYGSPSRSSPHLTLPQSVAKSINMPTSSTSSSSSSSHRRTCSPLHLTSPQVVGRFTLFVVRKPRSRPVSRTSSSLSPFPSPSQAKRKGSRRRSPARSPKSKSNSRASSRSPRHRRSRSRSRSRTQTT